MSQYQLFSIIFIFLNESRYKSKDRILSDDPYVYHNRTNTEYKSKGWEPQQPKRTIDPHNQSQKEMETDISVYKQRDEQDQDYHVEEDLNTLTDVFKECDKCIGADCTVEGVDYHLNLDEIQQSMHQETLYHDDDKNDLYRFFEKQLQVNNQSEVSLREQQFVVSKQYISLIDQSPEDDSGNVEDL